MPTDLIRVVFYTNDENVVNLDLEKILELVRHSLDHNMPDNIHYREES